MLWLLVVVFFILWILGLATVYTSAALTWLFFVLFIIFLISQFVVGRRHRPVEPKI